MDSKELKKFLAGLGIASLLAGTTLATGGCAKMGKSSCTGTKAPADKQEKNHSRGS